MALTADFKVGVAGEVVGQKADAAFERHHLCAVGQALYFGVGQHFSRDFQKSPGIGFKQADVEMHLGKILLVLRRRARAEADGIAEVVQGKPGHDGIQIDDADALSGFAVDQHIVQFGVVVGDPQGQLALFLHIHQKMRVFLTL